MLKRNLFILSMICSLSSPAFANEPSTEEKPRNQETAFRANLKRISLDTSSTEVKNAKEYQNSPNSKLSGDSETMVKGVFDFVLEYERPSYQWNNSLFMEYGKTKLKPVDGPDTTNETSDKILLTTDYSHKIWVYKDMDAGPFASLGYQTEFEPNDDAPRTKTFRGKTGLKLFNGKHVKEFYVAAVGELDLTYNREDTKSAYEIGLRYEYPLREGVKFEVESYFRDYLTYSAYEPTDFKYEFSFISRMDVALVNKFSLAPYIQYFRAEDRGSGTYGSNFMIGLSLAYSNLWDF